MSSEKYYKGIKKYEQHQVNPFEDDLLQEIEISDKRRIIAGNRYSTGNLMDSETGEVYGHKVISTYNKVDSNKFTKVFEKAMVEIFGFSRATLKIWGFFVKELKPNIDFIYFEIDECKKYTRYKSEASIMKGISELIEKKFIARSSKHYKYFINPTMFFNGSRLTLIKSYEIDPIIKMKYKIEPENRPKELPNSDNFSG